jgi:casein kinase II subunit beta
MGLIESILEMKHHDVLLNIPSAFLEDEFNLTGLSERSDVSDPEAALDCILDDLLPASDSEEESNQKPSLQTRRMYYLLHQRYVLSKGLNEVARLVEEGLFGKCPRHLCHGKLLLPCGESSKCGRAPLRGFCPTCRELYKLDAKRIDGACYGPSVAGMLMLCYPQVKAIASSPLTKYEPRIFGFRLSSHSN